MRIGEGWVCVMLRDLSFWVAVSQLALVLMGVWIALHEDWAKRHRFLVLTAFIVAGFAGLYMTRQQSRQSGEDVAAAQRQAAEANTKLSNTLEKINNQSNQIGSQTGEISRVQSLNTELQNKLLGQSGQLIDSSKQISDLSKEAINTTTGGESFCYMYVDTNTITGRAFPVFITLGKQPLYEVHARVADINAEDAILKRPHTINEMLGIQVNVGELSPITAKMQFDQVIPLSDPSRVDFNVFFDARNGTWTELLRMRKVGKNWIEAIRVLRDMRRNGKEVQKQVFEQIPKEFPEVPDWKKKKL
jgi:hypothetical protein